MLIPDYSNKSLDDLCSILVTKIQSIDYTIHSIPKNKSLKEYIEAIYPVINSNQITPSKLLKEWLPLLCAIKDQQNSMVPIENVIASHTIPNQKFSADFYSGFLIALFIRYSSIESLYLFLFDTIVCYLCAGQYDVASFILSFLNQSNMCSFVKIPQNNPYTKSLSELDTAEFASLFLSLECNSGQALIASSHVLTLWEAGNQLAKNSNSNSDINTHPFLTKSSVNKVLSSLMYSSSPLTPVNLKSIFQITKKLPSNYVSLTSSQKHKLIANALNFAKRPSVTEPNMILGDSLDGDNVNQHYPRRENYTFPSLANDTYDLVSHINGGPIPAEAIWSLISSNLHHKNITRCSRLYKDLIHLSTTFEPRFSAKGKHTTTQFSISWRAEPPKKSKHSKGKLIHYKQAGDKFVYNIVGRYHIMAQMVAQFSASSRYRYLADDLVSRIPKEMWRYPLMLEFIIEHCIKSKNQDVAVQVHQVLAEMEKSSKLGNKRDQESNSKIHQFSRSLLCSLLRLYVVLGDNAGVHQVLAEIQRRHQGLTAMEFSSIVSATLKSGFNLNSKQTSKLAYSQKTRYIPENLERAIALVQKAPPHIALFSYEAIINAAIHTGNDVVFYDFLQKAVDLVKENSPMTMIDSSQAGQAENFDDMFESQESTKQPSWVERISSLIVVSENYGLKYLPTVKTTLCNLVIKKINREQGSMAARLQYMKWKTSKRVETDDLTSGWVSEEHAELVNKLQGNKSDLLNQTLYKHQKLIDELEFGANALPTVCLGNIIDTAVRESFEKEEALNLQDKADRGELNSQIPKHRLCPESLFVVKWALNEYAHLGFHTNDILYDLGRRAKNVDLSPLESFFLVSS